MLAFILFQSLPAVLAFRAAGRLWPREHFFLRSSLAWFLGQFVSTLAVFTIACGVSGVSSAPLQLSISLFLTVLAAVVAVMILFNVPASPGEPGVTFPRRILSGCFPTLYAVFALLFAAIMYKPHLTQVGRNIFRSYIYWDFSLHFPTIQNFALGANFPPTNEVFAGAPLTNHYFFDLLCACYAVLAGGLVPGINLASVLSLFFLILLLGGLAHTLGGSLLGGAAAIVMAFTSSSLRFVHELSSVPFEYAGLWLKRALHYADNPYPYAMHSGMGYNGNMVNAFYFVVERQLVFACALLLIALFVIAQRRVLSTVTALAAGALMGLALQWHLFVTVLIGAAMTFVLCCDRQRRPAFFLLAGFAAALLPQLLWLLAARNNPEWFTQGIKGFPRLDFSFSSMPNVYPLSAANALKYYLFALGIKPLIALAGLWTIRRSSRFLTSIGGTVVIAMLLVNTIQLSPLSIYDNHKWLKPALLLMDLLCGVLLCRLLQGAWWGKLLAPVLFIALTLSGLIELVPYVNSRPNLHYAEFPSAFTASIMRNSPPRAVFLSNRPREILLSGRKLFLTNFTKMGGAQSVLEAVLNSNHRWHEARRIYLASSAGRYCRLVKRHQIDFIEIPPASSWPARLRRRLRGFPGFTPPNGGGYHYLSSAGCQRSWRH